MALCSSSSHLYDVGDMRSEPERASEMQWKSPLHQMTQTTPTCLWNDSAAIDELQFAIEHGARRRDVQSGHRAHRAEEPDGSSGGRGSRRSCARSRRPPKTTSHGPPSSGCPRTRPRCSVRRLRHTTAETGGCPSRPTRGSIAIRRPSCEQAERFDRIAPNILVKIPATSAGLAAIEAATAEGISINATVCFTLSQCVAVAEAVERGLERREAGRPRHFDDGPGVHDHGGPSRRLAESGDGEGRHHHRPGPSRMGRRRGVQEDLSPLPERGYRVRLLSAAFRNHMHWSELIGGDVVISPPSAWQKRFVASDIRWCRASTRPSIPSIVDDLHRRFADFRRAYDELAAAGRRVR